MTKTAFCFDLDGTITSEEILPLLAQELDIGEEIEALTEATIKGLLVFEKSFKLRIRLLKELSISRANKIVTNVKLEKNIVSFIQQNKEHCYIATGNLDVYISGLVEKIGCSCFCTTTVHKGDKLERIDKSLDKGSVVEKLRSLYDRIVVIGDGMNDVPMFKNATIKIAYGGVHSPVETLLKLSDYVTYDKKGLCNILNTLL